MIRPGKAYWYFTGQMEAKRDVVVRLENGGMTALIGGVFRKTSSLYASKEEAVRKFEY